MQELTRLHNDADFVPQANADITAWCPQMFLCIAQPAEQRDYGWISTAFRNIKTAMGQYIANFSQSGDLENDLTDHERDTNFFTRHPFQRMLSHMREIARMPLTLLAGSATGSRCICSFICCGITGAIPCTHGTPFCCLRTCAWTSACRQPQVIHTSRCNVQSLLAQA